MQLPSQWAVSILTDYRSKPSSREDQTWTKTDLAAATTKAEAEIKTRLKVRGVRQVTVQAQATDVNYFSTLTLAESK